MSTSNQSFAAPEENTMSTTEAARVTRVHVDHIELTFDIGFSAFCTRLEGMLGRFTESLRAEAPDEATFRARVDALAKDHGLLLFDVRDHGALLRLTGRPAQAKQYLIGNPLVALQMTSIDLRAGLYAPLRIFVYEPAAGQTRVEYDLPSTQFGQWGSPEVRAVGQRLDTKLRDLLDHVAATARAA